MITMKAYRITDLNTDNNESYTVTDPSQCKDKTDKAAVEMAMLLDDVIAMGKVIVEPIKASN